MEVGGHITVEKADSVQAGTAYPTQVNFYGLGAPNLPAACAITLHVQNSTD